MARRWTVSSQLYACSDVRRPRRWKNGGKGRKRDRTRVGERSASRRRYRRAHLTTVCTRSMFMLVLGGWWLLRVMVRGRGMSRMPSMRLMARLFVAMLLEVAQLNAMDKNCLCPGASRTTDGEMRDPHCSKEDRHSLSRTTMSTATNHDKN